MNVNRRARNGDVDENEIHKHQIYVTTAGYKNTFAYQKLIQVLVWMITRGNAFVLGGDYKIPVMHKLLDKDFIEELKEDGTYNPMSFAREYESNWTGTSEDAFFDSEFIDRNRILTESEYEPETGRKRKVEYVIATDVARVQGKKNADTVALVIKIIPRANGTYIKHIVNMFVFNGEHFENQSIKLKKIVFKYKARMLAIDANGLGVGLVDYLVKENADEVTGEIFPPFSVTNDSDYDKYKTSKSLPLLYNIKSTPANTTHIHVNCLSQISSDKVKFLTDEITSKAKLLSTKKGQKLTPEEVAKHLVPFILTTIMKEEMMNLKKKPEGKGVQLERINTRMGKDKFSALEYGLWYIKSLEDKNIKKDVNVDGKKFCMIKKPKYRKYH